MKKQPLPSGFEDAQRKASSILEEPERLDNLLKTARRKAESQKARLKSVKRDLELLSQLIKAYVNGEYTRIPWRCLVYLVGALVYFVNPLDMIPDFLTVFGFLDDMTVLGFVLNACREELDQFRVYLETKASAGVVQATG